MKRKLLVLLVLCLCVFASYTQTIEKGKIKVVVHEDYGRFSLYYLTDVENNTYTPMFIADDPRTTYLSVLSDNKIYKMGDSGGFTQEITSGTSRITLTWTSVPLKVEQIITFVRSPDSPVVDGIKLTIKTYNTSENPAKIGVRYLFDTWLGEDGTHFNVSSNRKKLTGEESYEGTDMPPYWISKEDSSDDFGFLGVSNNDDVTIPDLLVFANWKRLNDTSWSFEPDDNRSFNLLPYSINDSAVCYYFNEVKIQPGERREIIMMIGNINPSGTFSDGTISGRDFSKLFGNTVLQFDRQDPQLREAVNNDLIAIRDLVDQVNTFLDENTDPTAEELQILNEMLEEIERRKEAFEKRRQESQ